MRRLGDATTNVNQGDNTVSNKPSGPLVGVKIVEFAGIGPGPFACMMLSDMGADIVSIHRPGQARSHLVNFVNRGRHAIELDLKKPADVEAALKLIEMADVLVEGFRPGIMEKLGLGHGKAWPRSRCRA